jgi:streptomycin 3"-adenylyltransferase
MNDTADTPAERTPADDAAAADSAAAVARAYAAEVTAELDAVLDGSLTAAYLHGSAVLGGWTAERGDVDILFLAADDLSEAATVRAGQALLRAADGCPGRGGLECSIVTAGAAARPRPPWPFVLHVGVRDGDQVLYSGKEIEGDSDLLMHYAVCRAAGVTLTGPPPEAAIGVVDRHVILRYLADELGWGLANAPESYAVLNACRSLAYLRHGRIIGKLAGGLAALDERSGPAEVVRRALDQQRARMPEQPAGPDAVAFVEQTAAALRAAAAAPGASPPG